MRPPAAGHFDRNVWSVFGVPVDAASLDEAVARVRAAVETRTRLSFVTPNLNWLMRALRDREAMAQVQAADLSLADGAPVVWLARQLGAPVPERVAGSDLFDRLRTHTPGQKRIRVFFFGGREGAAEAAMQRLNSEEGGLIGCGALNPGYGSVEEMGAPVLFETINRARPDFVVVSLGAAKGQAWIARHQHRLEAPVIAHLGAVVDFVAGTIPRAPRAWSRLGLEWAWRIRAEPSLWRRYTADGLRLLLLIPNRLWTHQRDLLYLKDRGPLRVQAERTTRQFAIALDGNATAPHLAELRKTLTRALEAGVPVTLDLSQLGEIDTAALALLALAKARLEAAGRGLHILNASAVHRDILARMGLDGVPHPAMAQAAPASLTGDAA